MSQTQEEFHECCWCGTSIERRRFFCSKLCQHEYNTTQGADYEMWDRVYIVNQDIQLHNERVMRNGCLGWLIGGVVIPGFLYFKSPGLFPIWLLVVFSIFCLVPTFMYFHGESKEYLE